MKSYAGFIVILVASTELAVCQSSSILIGGRSTGMGNASAALKDRWALYNNPAGSSDESSASLNFTCAANPVIPGTNRAAACFVVPSKAGTFSVGTFKFGDDLYSEQLVSAGYSHSMGLASMGLRLDCIQYRAEGFEPALALGVTLGTVAYITTKLSLGGYVANLNRPKLPNGEALPVRMATGFEFRPSEKVFICGELEKDVDYSPTFKAGLEVAPLKKVHLRAGFNLCPNAVYSGIGIISWRIAFDYSLSYSAWLSIGHQVSLSFVSKQKNKKK